jgi:hypothetical protein
MEQQAREQAFISALTTEQFVLQAARSANVVGEMTGRAAVYMGAVSSALIAFGFLAQVVTHLDPFVAAVLPAVFLLSEPPTESCGHRPRHRRPSGGSRPRRRSARPGSRRRPSRRPGRTAATSECWQHTGVGAATGPCIHGRQGQPPAATPAQ